MNLRLIIDATSSHMEVIDSMRSHRYRGARTDKTFAHFAFDPSDWNMRGLLLYDPSQQGLNHLDELF